MPSWSSQFFHFFNYFSSVFLPMILATGLPPGAFEQTSGVIQLADNTAQGKVISESVLTPTQQRHYGNGKGILGGHRTYSLLQSQASRYFSLDSRKGQLRTARVVDRDLLCPEAGLCCQPSLLPDYRSCAGSPYTGPSLGPIRGQHDIRGIAQTQLCSFNLSVSVVSAEGQQPTIYDVPIYVCEENDHAPQFKVSPSSSTNSANNWPQYDSSSQLSGSPPVHVVDISESVSVGHRIRLPSAEDVDSPPFNVQRYELIDGFEHPGSFDSQLAHRQSYFKLETLKETSPLDLGRSVPAYHQDLSLPSAETITGLELVVLKALDREENSIHHLTVLAVDGGQPARTGTLRVKVIVIDANDHMPVFSRPVYEATVNEGETTATFNTRPILQVNATDRDEGENALILYDWLDTGGSSSAQSPSDEASLTREAMATAPPSFWFRLDNRTGAIYLRRPLDYELKRQHRFQVLAYNPSTANPSEKRGLIQKQTLPSATTNVIIQVHNLDDEPPLIVVDYVDGNQRQFKEIKENLESPYFVAFVTVNDPDLSGSPPTNHRVDNSGPSVDCQLDSHQESYRLERQTPVSLSSPSFAFDQWSSTSGAASTRVRFSLKTRRPLDREHSDEDNVLIRCWDSGIPPKTATAVVKVKILDENDCQPVVKVLIPTSSSTSRSSVGSSLSTAIEPWSKDKLYRWLTLHLHPLESHGWRHSPLLLAYLANIRVYTLHIVENQPVGTVVARLQAVDRDAGENSRVTFNVPGTTVGLSLPLVNDPSGIDSLRKYSHAFDSVGRTVELHNRQKPLDYFKLHPNTGELSVLQEIDREETVSSDEDSAGMLEQMFLFVKASDNGSPKPKFTVLLLQIRILDVNDNPPIFCDPEMRFEVSENLPAPTLVGEVQLLDRDVHSHGCNSITDHAGYPLSSAGQSDQIVPGGGAPRRTLCTQLNLRIDPGHGRRSIPFVVYCTKQGRFFINTTQVLDKESEAVFRFNLIATDTDGRHSHVITREGVRLAERQPSVYTAVATVLVTVLDVNDNRPEIIFPNPATSNSTTHRVSYYEMAGYDILHVNAKDRDATESNRKLSFDVMPEIAGDNIFTIDRVTGVLRTRRRMTKDDMGEHRVKVVVRDEGSPSLETHVTIRLVVDNSVPEWGFSSTDKPGSSLVDSSISNQVAAAERGGHLREAGHHYSVHDRFGQSGNYPGSAKVVTSAEVTNIILVTIMVLILGLLVVMVALCFYLRHKRNIFQFLPDVCSLCLLPSIMQSGGHSTGGAGAASDIRSKKKLQTNGKAGELGEIDPLTTVPSSRGIPSNEAAHLLNGDCSHGGKLLRIPPSSHQKLLHRDPQKHPDGELMTSLLSSDPSSSGGAGCPSELGQVLSPMSMQQDFYAGMDSGYPLLGSTLTDCCDPRATVMCSPLPIRERTAFSPMMGMRAGRLPHCVTTATNPADVCVTAPGVFTSSVYHRPGTTSCVRIPDVADQAEMMHKKYVDYCRSMQSSSDLQQTTPHDRCSVRPLGDSSSGYHTSPSHVTSRHAYNTGLPMNGHSVAQQAFSPIHRPARVSDACYFNAGNRQALPPTTRGFMSPAFGLQAQPYRHPPHGFLVDPSHEMSFRPIRDEPHMYQRIDPNEMYATGKLRPNGFADPAKMGILVAVDETGTGMQPVGEGTTVLWRSDPSLCNQPHLRFPGQESDGNLTAATATVFPCHGRQNVCSPPPLLLDGCRHHHHQHSHQQTQQQKKMKRSKSMQRQQPATNGTSTTTAAYYSLLHQPLPHRGEVVENRQLHQEQQPQLDTLPLVDLGDEEGTSDQSSGATGSGGVAMATGANEQTGPATENYAVSYPKVQASFV